MPAPEVPKFIKDLIEGLNAITAQLDAAVEAIKAKRNAFNNLLETKLKNYGFEFTTNLYNTFKTGVESGHLRVAGLLKELEGDKGNNGIINALDELSKLEIKDVKIVQADLVSAAGKSDEVRTALETVTSQIDSFATKDKAKSKRKSEITKAIQDLGRAMFNYVAVIESGLDPEDLTPDMNVDALQEKINEKRKRALDEAISDDFALALGIDKNRKDLKLISIKEVPTKMAELETEKLTLISGKLEGPDGVGPQLELLGKKLADVQEVTEEFVKRHPGKTLDETIDNLGVVYKETMKPDTDEYVKAAITSAADGCDPGSLLPPELRGGEFEAVIRGVILNGIQRDEESVQEKVWTDPASVPTALADKKSFSDSLKETENGLAEVYNTFSTKVAALAAEDKKLADKIAGLVDIKMKNIDSEAAVTKTLDEIKKVLQKSTGVNFGVPADGA